MKNRTYALMMPAITAATLGAGISFLNWAYEDALTPPKINGTPVQSIGEKDIADVFNNESKMNPTALNLLTKCITEQQPEKTYFIKSKPVATYIDDEGFMTTKYKNTLASGGQPQTEFFVEPTKLDKTKLTVCFQEKLPEQTKKMEEIAPLVRNANIGLGCAGALLAAASFFLFYNRKDKPLPEPRIG